MSLAAIRSICCHAGCPLASIATATCRAPPSERMLCTAAARLSPEPSSTNTSYCLAWTACTTRSKSASLLYSSAHRSPTCAPFLSLKGSTRAPDDQNSCTSDAGGIESMPWMCEMAALCGPTSAQWPTIPCSSGDDWQPRRAMRASHCSGLPAIRHDLLSLTMRRRTQPAAAPIASIPCATCALVACSTKPRQKLPTGASAGSPHAERSAFILTASCSVHTGDAASRAVSWSDFLAFSGPKAKSIDTSPSERPHAARGATPSTSRATAVLQKAW